MEYKSFNRYKNGTLVKDWDGDWVLPPDTPIDTRFRPDDRYHLVKQEERLDLLAFKYFGDARLWWVIAEYNSIFWFLDLKEGQELRLPSYNTLQMFLLV